MEYITRDGLRIEVGRVNRRLLDAIAIPEPQPPLRDVETWGGLVERVPVYDDAGYKRQLQQWRTQTWRANLNVITPGLTFTIPDRAELDALQSIGLGTGTPADHLRFRVGAYDQERLVALIYYLSTVTVQGIREAEQRFAYKWRDKPLSAWTVGLSYGQRGPLAVDYRAAIRAGMSWAQFCALSGPEQSELVAFWSLEDRLNWLMNNAK